MDVRLTIRFEMGSLSYGSFLWIPIHKDGDVIVAAGNTQRKEVVEMNREIYTYIGIAFIWCVKYVFIPLGVTVSARIIVDKLLQPLPIGQRKKRSNKNCFK